MTTFNLNPIERLAANTHSPDRDALFHVLADEQSAKVLACFARSGTLVQIAAALRLKWSWLCDGWEQYTHDLLELITNPRCTVSERIIETWSLLPNAVGVLHEHTKDLIVWTHKHLGRVWYANLAVLIGPSDDAVNLMLLNPYGTDVETTLRLWSMATDPQDPTAWQQKVSDSLRTKMKPFVESLSAFPAWGLTPTDRPAWGLTPTDRLQTIVDKIFTDLFNGWDPDHPSIRGRIAWLEDHARTALTIDMSAIVSGIGNSSAFADVVAAWGLRKPEPIQRIAEWIPWSRLNPIIQAQIDTSMLTFSEEWKRPWRYALGHKPIPTHTPINGFLLLWRIGRDRWDSLDLAIRAKLVSRVPIPDHCYAWGVHPDLIGKRWGKSMKVFRFWNRDVPITDIQAWGIADLLHEQTNYRNTQMLIDLLAVIPSNLRARFETIIDWRVGGRSQPTAHAPWDWSAWSNLPAVVRRNHLRDRLRVLWRGGSSSPIRPLWAARDNRLDTVAIMVRALLGRNRAPRVLAALLAQVPRFRDQMTDPGPPPPMPKDLAPVRRAQIGVLPLNHNDRRYAAWCLLFLDHHHVGDVAINLIALHPDVAIALAPYLSSKQRRMVDDTPDAKAWDSMTLLRWYAACASDLGSSAPSTQSKLFG